MTLNDMLRSGISISGVVEVVLCGKYDDEQLLEGEVEWNGEVDDEFGDMRITGIITFWDGMRLELEEDDED